MAVWMFAISHRFAPPPTSAYVVSTSNFRDNAVSAVPKRSFLYDFIRWNISSIEASRNTSSAFIRRLSLASR